MARVDTHLTLHVLQRQLAAANAMLKTSNDDLRAFAHTVAHDLKSPLSVLIGYGELLKHSTADMSPAKITKILHTMVQMGLKMSDIIDALLLLADVQQAKQVSHQPLAMGAIVSQVLAQLAPQIEATHAEIVLPETWPVVQSYEPWIEQVWTNYISNAIKYGGDGETGLAPHIELGVYPAEGQDICRFFVRDNGPGLTPQEQAQLFTPFTRLHHDQATGHGLGLSIVQRIVEKLGGSVGVETAGAGRGSIFWFELPAII